MRYAFGSRRPSFKGGCARRQRLFHLGGSPDGFEKTMTSERLSAVASSAIVSRAKRYLRGITDPIRYRLRLHFQPRQNHIYTHFYRFRNQYDVLLEHVLPRIIAARAPTQAAPLEVAVFACCSGEEVYTLAYLLSTRLPGVPFKIRGYDLVPDLIEQARRARYTSEHVRSSPFVTDQFVAGMFDRQGDECVVKPELTARTSFEIGDITDEASMSRLPKSELVFAQNVLFHLPRPAAQRAFDNLVGVLRSGGALFVNGMDTDMRVKLSRQHRLEPVNQRIAEIHEDARIDRGANWADSYWGREPFKMSGDWVRKYCTIFTKQS
jgi:chemotaxis protein methyltransferase CheR